MEQQSKNMRDLGNSREWPPGSLEQRLVEMTVKAGYVFEEQFIAPHTYKYTCKEAGLTYWTAP